MYNRFKRLQCGNIQIRKPMRIIYKTENGGVAVIVPSDTIEDCMKDIPEGAVYEIVEDSDVPEDRTWRDAWVYS